MQRKLVIVSVFVACIAVYRGGPLGSNGTELADYRMLRVGRVINCVIIASRSVPVLAAATKVSAGHAQPEVCREVAIGAVGQGFCCNALSGGLVQK